MSHHESKRQTESLQVVQTSYAWRSDSSTIFKAFFDGKKVSSENSASEI